MNLPTILTHVRRLPAAVVAALADTGVGRWRTLRRLLRAHYYELAQVEGQFSGPGWDKLTQELAESRFVLVGESHGLAQVPAFTQAVAERFAPQVFVAELDACQAQDLADLVAQPGPPVAYLREHPSSLAFYSWAEEFELVRFLRARQVELWGIDQVFLASTGRYYARLAEQVRDPATQARLREWATRYQAQDRAALQAGTNDFSMFTQPPAAVQELLALVQAESPAVQALARAYALSHHIYQQQLAGTGGHQQRVNLLKRNLLALLLHWQAGAQLPWPRVLAKMGALHLARNLSPLVSGGYFDVGNLLQNLAEVQDQQSLHLFIVGKRGTQAVGSHPDDPTQNSVAYGPEEFAFLKPFFRRTGTAWAVFDLRPLREAALTNKLRLPNQNLLRTILGYDLLVVIPETTASQGY